MDRGSNPSRCNPGKVPVMKTVGFEQRAYLKSWIQSAKDGDQVDTLDAGEVEELLNALEAAEENLRLETSIRDRSDEHNERLQKRVAELESKMAFELYTRNMNRIAALESALAKYGQHTGRCKFITSALAEMTKTDPMQCTCGFNAVKAGGGK